MDSLCDQVKQIATSVSLRERHQILGAIQNAYQDIEKSQNARSRARGKGLEGCLVELADDINLFRSLAEADRPLTADEVAEKSNAFPGFIRRILCFLASRSYISEVGEDRFAPNKLTQTLALEEFSADIHMNVTVAGPIILAMPHFFRKKGYIDNMSIWDCPFQMGRQTDQSIHEWTQGRPELIHYYNRYTQSHHKMLRPFTDVYPIEDLFDDMEPDQPFFIDVGGGYGQQALAIKVTYPYARVILEDLPTQLRGLDLGEDVEIIPQDCFEEQKIKGARIYYLRHVLHDCPDAACVTILRNLADAMDEKSVILIDETVMPRTGATYHNTLYDMAMMALYGSKERTKAQWEQLLVNVDRGLKIRRTMQYSQFNYAIIEVVKQP